MAVVSLASVSLVAQSASPSNPKPAPGKWRTAWGDPDLQGSWSNATTTPLQRPAKFAGREFLTPEEKAALDRETDIGTDRRNENKVQDVNEAYNRFWWDRGYSDGRTSLIFDPPDGKIPALTPEGQKRRAAFRRTEGFGEDSAAGRADSWLDRSQYERCIIRAPLPRVPSGYDNNYQIVQTPGYVAIIQEQMHETRLIPLDGRAHLDKSVRQWLGDSRGHWEGDTLVVETTNFSDRTDFEGSGPNMRLVERWTRVADDHIDYRFTVEDPTTWTRPWSAAIGWNKIGLLYEYACHEGNYGLQGILEGGRAADAEAAAKAGKQ
jgi:hypothetical protein